MGSLARTTYDGYYNWNLDANMLQKASSTAEPEPTAAPSPRWIQFYTQQLVRS